MPESFELYIDDTDEDIWYWVYWSQIFEIGAYSIPGSGEDYFIDPLPSLVDGQYFVQIQVDEPATVLANYSKPPSVIFGQLADPTGVTDLVVEVVNADNDIVGGGIVKLSNAVQNSKPIR